MKSFSTKHTITYSLEEMISVIGQLSLFEYYLGHKIKFGSAISSPFRRDSTPSCHFKWFNGVLLMKDFGTGETFSIVSFIKKKHNLSTLKEVEILIKRDFKNILETKKLPVIKYSSKKNNTSNNRLIFRTHRIPYSSVGVNYWKEYGISMDTLKRFNVYQIDTLFINDFFYSYDTPTFEYCFSFSGRKILSPYLSTENKWRSNLPFSFIEGESLLPQTGDVLIITKSYKDVMTLWELDNIPAVSPISENSIFLSFTDEKMKELKRRFNRIYILFDNDNTGDTFSKEFSDKYNIQRIILPLEKDISDLVKNHGKSLSQSIIRKSILF